MKESLASLLAPLLFVLLLSTFAAATSACPDGICNAAGWETRGETYNYEKYANWTEICNGDQIGLSFVSAKTYNGTFLFPSEFLKYTGAMTLTSMDLTNNQQLRINSMTTYSRFFSDNGVPSEASLPDNGYLERCIYPSVAEEEPRTGNYSCQEAFIGNSPNAILYGPYNIQFLAGDPQNQGMEKPCVKFRIRFAPTDSLEKREFIIPYKTVPSVNMETQDLPFESLVSIEIPAKNGYCSLMSAQYSPETPKPSMLVYYKCSDTPVTMLIAAENDTFSLGGTGMNFSFKDVKWYGNGEYSGIFSVSGISEEGRASIAKCKYECCSNEQCSDGTCDMQTHTCFLKTKCEALDPSATGPASRLDVLFIWDGIYVEAEGYAQFLSDLVQLKSKFLSVEPYKDNANKFNFWFAQLKLPYDIADKTNHEKDAAYVSDYVSAYCSQAEKVVFVSASTFRSYALVNLIDGGTTSFVSEGYSGGEVGPVILHEFGHLLGLGDEYVEEGGTIQTTVPNCAMAQGITGIDVEQSKDVARMKWGDITGMDHATDWQGCGLSPLPFRSAENTIMRDPFYHPFLGPDADYGEFNNQLLTKALSLYG